MNITAKNFLGLTEEGFIGKMSERYPFVLDDPLGYGQIKAWRDCYRILQTTARELSEGWSNKLWMVFEYTLPTSDLWDEWFADERHCHADADHGRAAADPAEDPFRTKTGMSGFAIWTPVSGGV